MRIKKDTVFATLDRKSEKNLKCIGILLIQVKSISTLKMGRECWSSRLLWLSTFCLSLDKMWY